jgi:hypothetical protein
MGLFIALEEEVLVEHNISSQDRLSKIIEDCIRSPIEGEVVVEEVAIYLCRQLWARRLLRHRGQSPIRTAIHFFAVAEGDLALSSALRDQARKTGNFPLAHC